MSGRRPLRLSRSPQSQNRRGAVPYSEDASRRGLHRPTFPGECSRIGEIAAPRVHEGAAEVEVRLILVVCSAAQLDVFWRGRSAHREGSSVVELDVARLAAATSSAVYIA